MGKIEKIDLNRLSKEELGLLLWQLEEMEHFYPVYKTMIKKDDY